jgi:hypothetical protein
MYFVNKKTERFGFCTMIYSADSAVNGGSSARISLSGGSDICLIGGRSAMTAQSASAAASAAMIRRGVMRLTPFISCFIAENTFIFDPLSFFMLHWYASFLLFRLYTTQCGVVKLVRADKY